MSQPGATTLQLFHVADQEANTESVTQAPNFSAVLNALRAEDIDGDGAPGFANSLTLSSGDVWIPGLFYDASASVYGLEGAADILIQNELGMQAIAFGNHEFDNGTEIIAQLLAGVPPSDGLEPFAGAAFPYLSSNLDFEGDPDLAGLVTADAQDATAIAGRIAASTIVETAGGMRVGVVGATTPTIDVISSPGPDVEIRPVDFDGDDPDDVRALAAEIQVAVDALLAAEPELDKVILLAHMQRIAIERDLAGLLRDVDIIVAGGSNTRLFDENDAGFGGEAGQGVYPIFETDADGNPVAVVNTDFQYKYVGRLVLDFDDDGVLVPESYDPSIGGAYATDAAGLDRVGAAGLADPEIVAIAEAVEATIVEGESEFYAVTDVFLNGERQGGGLDGVRTQETNLGNLTADANLSYMRQFDPDVVVSIKNGGGIRASIGQKFVPGGADRELRLPPEAVPSAGKPEGGISENAVVNTLAFNNGLSLLSLTTEQLAATLEHLVGEFTSLEVDSGMGQVSGVRFSFEPDAAVGERIVNAGVFDVETGELIAEIVEAGEVVDNGDQTFRTVTLNFLADGGSGYPFPDFEGTDRLDLFKDEDGDGRIDEDAPTSGAVDFADVSEQDALAEYLLANFGTGPDAVAFDEPDTPAAEDERIQNLDERGDAVFGEVEVEQLRVATFNASLNRDSEGGLIADLAAPDDRQAQSVAEIIQRTRPDVLLLNEFDFDPDGVAADLFRANYLELAQSDDVEAIDYPYAYVAASNTGVPSGFDLDDDGTIGGPGDAFGFGFFPGQFGFVVFSKYEIDTANVRTFQEFLWKDMPEALLFETGMGRPLFDPGDPAASFYSADEVEVLRLSSKNHVDLPIRVGDETLHLLAAHPTPPVFDGAEDRNGKRNFDEIRFWKDYVAGADYIYDDAGVGGGLAPDTPFVIVGDYNADPFDGDSVPGAARQLLLDSHINGSPTDPEVTPASEGGRDAAERQEGANRVHRGDPAFDTADFNDDVADDGPGNLRVDYALPSREGLALLDGGVFWPKADDRRFELVGDVPFPASDHRLAFVDVAFADDRRSVAPIDPTPARAGLHVLLTNDDGFDASGIVAMRDALLAAGHTVTVVAPAQGQSGRGTAIDTAQLFRPLEITEFRPGAFNLDTTPVITTIAALDEVLAGKAPDLVISGINEGANVGEIAASSGTVSAAVTAVLRGVPALAISADGGDREQAQSAQLVAALVEDLAARAADGLALLPEGTGLNVNVPEDWNGREVAFTTVSGGSGLDFVFLPDPAGSDDLIYTFSLGEPTGAAESEGLNFGAGNATISAIDGDWTARGFVGDLEDRLLDGLDFEDPSPAAEVLDILLVNDDGFEAEGITKLAAALRDAGHSVTIVAPLEPQSGRGTDLDVDNLTLDPSDPTLIEVTEFAPGDFAVASTPVVVTRAGLRELVDETPDLVVSGINEGENTGRTAISSGTVSAAVAALYAGVPSLAVSAGIDLAGDGTTPGATFDNAAAVTVDLIADLIATAGEGPLLPDGVGLSVNVPTGEIAGVSFTELDEVASIGFGFGELPSAPGEVGPIVDLGTPTGDPRSEGSEFLLGNITVTPIDGNYTADAATRFAVEQRITAGEAFRQVLAGEGAERRGDFLGVAEIESFTVFDGTIVGGLSGIAYDPASRSYLAVSDDRGAGPDGTPRFYELAIDLSDALLRDSDVEFRKVTEFTLPDGTTLDAIRPDLEGIAIGPDGDLFVASERDVNGDPAVYRFTREGVRAGELPVDDKFLPDAAATQGVRSNLGFESLTVTPDGRTLYTASESALLQDGAPASVEVGAPARIIRYDVGSGEPTAEFVYEVDPIPEAPVPADAFADSGLVELLAIDNEGSLLALERAFATGAPARGYTGKLYLVQTQAATNVIASDAVPTVVEADGEADINVDELVTKQLLVDLGELGIAVDNVEGMTLGPVLPDGRQSLIIVSDDNFSAFGPQATQFTALAIDLERVATIEPLAETPDELRFPGPAPLVIGHRGASGELPEHTLGSYARAINDGADFIEPDLVTTADGVLIARHEPYLATVATDAAGDPVLDANGDVIVDFRTTDVADKPEFADRLTTKQLTPFTTVTGWFAEDFTLEEIKTLRAVEDQPDLRPQAALFDGLFEIPTLDEIIDLVQAHEARTGEQIGIYPETKEPTFFDARGLSLEEPLIATLVEQGFTDPNRVFIQSFEIANLLDLEQNIMPAAGVDLPLVQLLFNAPSFPTVDLIAAQQAGDLSAYASLPFVDATTTSGDLRLPQNLATIAAVYADGIGPSFSLVIEPDGSETSLVEDARAADLLVHGYTHADERDVVAEDGSVVSGAEAYERLLATGVDGIFTDNPATGRKVTDAIFAPEGPDPDDPAIWRHPDDASKSVVITAMKNDGLRVYDLAGDELQRLVPDDVRYNNVDVLYGVTVGDEVLDLAVVSDRANDTLAIFAVDAQTGLLSDITAAALEDPAVSIFGVDDGEATAYGLATYRSPVDGRLYAFTTQADGSNIAQLELSDAGGGTVTADVVRTIPLPVPDGEDAEDFQSEGIAVDRETGVVYVAVEEELGLVAFGAEPSEPAEVEVVADIDAPFFAPDLEGVAILYGRDGGGAIVVSSQGDASFAVFDRESWEFLGSFAIGATDTIDGVEESDGLDIFPAALGASFPNGLLVTQDGSNEPAAVFGDPEDGEIQNFNVNFKLSDLADVVARLDVPAPDARFDPRALVRSGTPDDDVIRASPSGPEILLGGSGDDRLLGGDGFAVLRGGDGRDTMQAGAGGARLAGGEDRDVLIGGGGPDTFVLDGAGPDVVRDFDPAFDVVEIAIAGVRDIALREVATNQILAVDDGSGFEDVAAILGGGVEPDAVVDPFVG